MNRSWNWDFSSNHGGGYCYCHLLLLILSLFLSFEYCTFDSTSFATAADVSPKHGYNNASRARPTPPTEPPSSQIPDYISAPIREKHETFLRNVTQLILDHALFLDEENNNNSLSSPFTFKTPEQLSKLIDIKLSENGTTQSDLLQIISKVIEFSPHPSHPFMLDKRISGLDPYSLAVDWIISTTSLPVLQFIAAPIFSLMEIELSNKLSQLIGWKSNSGEDGEGICTTGAGTSNSLAVALGLQAKYPDLKEKGLVGVGNPKVVIFVSELASYAFDKAAVYQGLAINWIVKVKTDPTTGKMNVSELRYEIKKVKADLMVPLMVVATAGTQLLGSIDPIFEIGTICQEYGLWFHVDAEKGSLLIFDPKQNTIGGSLYGIAKADSVTFGTWLLSTPYVSTMLLVKSKGTLVRSFGTRPAYLYTEIVLYNTSYDIGDLTVQTTRRAEVAKLWYSWKGRGFKGIQSHISKTFQNTKFLIKELKSRPGFKTLLQKFELPQIAFQYIPEILQNASNSPNLYRKLNKLTWRIKQELFNCNLLQLSIGELNGENFFIISLTNSILEETKLKYILDIIQSVGEFKSKNPTKKYSITDASTIFPTTSLEDSIEQQQLPPSFVNAPVKILHKQFFEDVFNLIINKGIFFKRSDSPYKFVDPLQLQQQIFNFTLDEDNNNELFKIERKHQELLENFEKIIEYSPHRAHPYNILHLLTSVDPYTLAADFISSTLNTPMISYEDSPIFTLMQEELLAEFRLRIFGTREGDGVVTDGGSMANQIAMAIGRHAKDKRVKYEGIGVVNGKKFIAYISEDGHFSIRKGAILQSIGADNVVAIASNSIGQMDVAKLKEAIEATLANGDIPYFVCILIGTTIYGAIDPIDSIVDVCKEYNLWCHVDGMFGGLLAMSDKYLPLPRLKGIERVDSYGIDIHKLMGATIVCAVLITKRTNIFQDTFEVQSSTNVDFPKPPNGIILPYNKELLGDKHWQIDKRNNIFKFWLLWKAKGRKGFEQHINLIMENAQYLTQQLHQRKSEGFLPVIDKFELTSVCFFYIPSKLRTLDPDSAEFDRKISKLSFEIQKALVYNGVMSVVAQKRQSISLPRNTTAAFIKFPMMGSSITKADVDYLLDSILYYGELLTA